MKRLVGARRSTWLEYEITGFSMAWFKPLARRMARGLEAANYG